MTFLDLDDYFRVFSRVSESITDFFPFPCIGSFTSTDFLKYTHKLTTVFLYIYIFSLLISNVNTPEQVLTLDTSV